VAETVTRPIPLRKRAIQLGVAAAAAALTVSACSSGGGGSSAGQSGSASKTIEIGMASVLSGPNSADGEVDNGAIAYLKYINASGGINGYKFQWTVADTQFTAAGTISAVDNLVDSDKAQAIVGVGTVPILALKPIASRLKVPILMAGNGALFTPPMTNMFDITPDFDAMYPAEYAYAEQLTHNGKVGVIYENDDAGQPVLTSIPNYVKATGAPSPVAMLGAPLTVTDCTPYMARLQKDQAQAVVFGSAPQADACMVKAAAALGYHPQYVGNWELTSPSYDQLLGPLFVGQQLLDYQISLSGNSPAAELFLNQMKKYDPTDLTSGLAEQGWDFGAVLADAVAMATKSGKQFSQAGLLSALNDGFTGQSVALLPHVTFNSSEHYGTLSMGSFVTTGGGGHKATGAFAPLPKPYGTS
jgi:ABC-type branched-subunit amino acid transport system substrate-binding protein